LKRIVGIEGVTCLSGELLHEHQKIRLKTERVGISGNGLPNDVQVRARLPPSVDCLSQT
jgi:hypothetical protein